MPRRKQWFPVSLELNDDPEVWDLTDSYGDRALRVLLEYYRILDKTENRFRDKPEYWLGIFRKCRVHPTNGWKIRDQLVTNGWLAICQGDSTGFPQFCGSPNYWKYHGTPEPEGIVWVSPPNLTKPNRIRVSSYKNTQRPASPVLDVKNSEEKRSEEKHMASMNLISELKKETDRLYYSDPVKFKKLGKWVAQGRKNNFRETDMAAALREFWDYRVIDDWYEYCDSILDRIVKDRNARESTQEHEKHKEEIREASKMFLVK